MMMHKKCNMNSLKDHMHHMKYMAYCFHTIVQNWLPNNWIVDTGASSHMYGNFDLLWNLRTLAQLFHVALPNKHLISITKVGDIIIYYDITLYDVLYISYSLLSVSKLNHENNCIATFFTNYFVFQDQTKQNV